MSRQEAVEFVCYQEHGIYNLDRVLDDLLPPIIQRSEPDKPTVEVQHSFHDMLLIRSRDRVVESRRKGSLARRESLLKSAGWMLGDVLIFSGGGAIGAGIMAMSRGETFGGGAGAIIACGLTAIGVTLVIRIVSKASDAALSNTARI